MATISTKTTTSLVISEDEKCWLAFGNLALAEIANCVNQMGDEIMNENTGEILETSDIKHAFTIIDTLIDKEAHWVQTESSETEDVLMLHRKGFAHGVLLLRHLNTCSQVTKSHSHKSFRILD